MKQYEITFNSMSIRSDVAAYYPKPITALIIAPDKVTDNTGAMLFSHGTGGNRFQNQEQMQATADEYDLVCIAVEYRQSGYDYDPVGGYGWSVPYDLSFYQTFDVLNAMRMVLEIYGRLNHQRLYHYGGSQGGHIALLGSVFAPNTFAALYVSCPLTHVYKVKQQEVGREFAPYELSVRNALEHCDAIQCPVFNEYGTNDEFVDYTICGGALAERLQLMGKQVQTEVYQGGGHSLEPVTTKIDAYNKLVPSMLQHRKTDTGDDFTAGSIVEIQCADRRLMIDWSQAADNVELFAWK